MRRYISSSLLIMLLLSMVMLSAGCRSFFDQPGQTAAEVHRDHIRMLRVNQQELIRDVDRSLHLDQPSKLTDRTIP